MAPLLTRYFRPTQRSLLSYLFTATFLGAVLAVAFPCPARPDIKQKRLDEEQIRSRAWDEEVLERMRGRGRRKILEER